ncbi:hypothetical protein F4780DRAFT_753994 [Xylariomycetidae sp. FL0641]|nr:hypothetical protein F4780DRAFT_753994 [Xylariomycetidae sp. FL0641]
MSFTKTYFLCPTSDFIHPPPTGPLCLGSIIRSTSAPQYPLNRASVVAVSDALPPAVETDWKKTISTEKGLGLGVYAQFLQLATGGCGSEVNVEHSNETANTFAFDTVTTLAFEPTLEYVQEAVKAPAVQTWLREPRQRFALVSKLFMVTGMKLVKGAKIQYSASQNTAVEGNLGIEVTALDTTLGPKGHWASTNDDATESKRESEFVFAFRVKRLKFGRRLKLEDYNKGAFMAVGGKEDDNACVTIEDVDGADIETAEAVPDVTENGNVYCVPA